MILSNTLRAAIAASALLAAGSLFAATDGDQGSTSTGTTSLSVTKTSEVKISVLSDIALTVQADGSATGTTDACIYRNGTGTYSLTASGSGAASAFSLGDGSNVMPYAVTFDDGSGATALTKNTAVTGLSGADTLSTTCNGSTNATIAITVATADFSSAPAGAYTGTLTLVIAPE